MSNTYNSIILEDDEGQPQKVFYNSVTNSMDSLPLSNDELTTINKNKK